MARQPKYSIEERRSRRIKDTETEAVAKPEGKFVREKKIHITTQRSPHSVTKINPEDMKPILPEMPYIPPQ
jgi:hypothetical protein